MRMWNTWREMEELRRSIDQLFNGFTPTAPRPQSRFVFLPGHSARAYPSINIHEDADHYYVYAVAPGVDPQSLDISVMGAALTIKGEKKRNDKDVKPEAYHRSERAEGKFIRTVELPTDVKAEHVSAEYKNGLLTITLPKAEEAKSKAVAVKVA
ncbi:MAG: Hsp20/alpha crystallin family protein [Candidatus Omnitrophota bacterium]